MEAAITTVEPTFHMWLALGFVVAVILFYIWEPLPVEVISVTCLAAMITVFHIMPLPDASGENMLDAEALLAGFANPALVTVVCLVIVGQALVSTGAISPLAGIIARLSKGRATPALYMALILVCVISAFLNDTPVVVIFIPILHALTLKTNHQLSEVMMPLSFAAILGGVTTLMGTSTNILVSRTLHDLGHNRLGFFETTPIGSIIALVGMAYVLLIMPGILRRRHRNDDRNGIKDAREFTAHLTIQLNSPLIGKILRKNEVPELPDVTLLMIWRARRALIPPLEGITLQPADILVIAAPRSKITDGRVSDLGLIPSDAELAADDRRGDSRFTGHRQVTEAVVTPHGQLAGKTIGGIHFLEEFNCLVLGIQRQTAEIRAHLLDIRLQGGDVLLLYGSDQAIADLHGHRDLVVLQQTTEDMPGSRQAKRALAIFAMVIGLAATEILPISIASLLGASLMILTGTIRLTAALQSINSRLVFLIATSIALGFALERTGGAGYLAEGILTNALTGASPAMILSVYFLIVAVFTNMISNNACAVLFTPIGVHTAIGLGVDPHIFAMATLFAANCSFATPIGFQTNLLVMGPGRYRFADFVLAGTPLAIIVWLTFSIAAPIYYSL